MREEPRPVASSPRTAPAIEASASAFSPGDAERGKLLVAAFECNRCHEGTGLSAPGLEQDCVGCHEQIARGTFPAKPEKLEKWKPHIMKYRDVPSLTELGARLRPGWVKDYLLHPRDLRPNLAQTMPRLALSPEQAGDIATYLTRSGRPSEPSPPLLVTAAAVDVARGKQLLTDRGCVGCHQVSGAGLTPPPKSEPAPRTRGLAPDLRFARERSEPSTIANFLLDPLRVKHDSAMPNLGLSPAEARDLAAFLSFGELAPTPPPAPVERLPVLTRRVTFDEVNERVFAVTCRHCHTNPDLADGDGGPGSSGGFGFKPRKIDFSSYQGIQSGAIGARGERVSLFAPTKDGVPLLVSALLARQRETTGDESGEARGMPLGLPPLSDREIQLVESWVAQGRPL